MAVRIYRNHSLALGVMSAIIALVLAPTPFNFPVPFNVPLLGSLVSFIDGMSFILIFCAFFAFIDSTIPIARRSDPLLRPFLHWDRIRKILWVLLVAAVASWVLLDFGGFPVWALFVVFLPVVVGVPALLIGSRRSGDPLFRRSLRWVGLAILLFGVGILTFLLSGFFLISPYDFSSSYFAIPPAVFLCLAGYSFYLSARSLAPTNRLEMFETDRVPTTAVSPKRTLAP